MQVWNFWKNQAWKKYKVVQQLQNYTGGGDAEADPIGGHDGNNDDSESEEKDTEAADNKKSAEKKKLEGVKYSMKVLQAFENSKLFEMIVHV